MEPTRKAASMLSKKRYQQISDMLSQVFQDEQKVNEALTKIQEIMQFDPEMSTYTPEIGKRKQASLKKRCEETGKTTYEILHSRRIQSKQIQNVC